MRIEKEGMDYRLYILLGARIAHIRRHHFFWFNQVISTQMNNSAKLSIEKIIKSYVDCKICHPVLDLLKPLV
jgi:hypothetical protein